MPDRSTTDPWPLLAARRIVAKLTGDAYLVGVTDSANYDHVTAFVAAIIADEHHKITELDERET